MTTVATLIEIVAPLAAFAVVSVLWWKGKVSAVGGTILCLIFLALAIPRSNFDRAYRRPVPETIVKNEIPVAERAYLLRGIRQDVLAQPSLFDLHRFTLDVDEAHAAAALRDMYAKTSPLWKRQHAVELANHLVKCEKNGLLRTPFPMLPEMMRNGNGPRSRERDWKMFRMAIRIHVVSREYKMLGLLLYEYTKQMGEFRTAALWKGQVERQSTADLAAIDDALSGADGVSDRAREALTFVRSLDGTNGRPEQTAQTTDNRTEEEADVLSEAPALAEAIPLAFFIAAKIVPPDQTTFRIGSPGGDSVSFTKIKSGVWRPSFIPRDYTPEWSVEGSILHQACLGSGTELDVTQILTDADTTDWASVSELKHEDTPIATLSRRDKDVTVMFGTPPDRTKCVIEW